MSLALKLHNLTLAKNKDNNKEKKEEETEELSDYEKLRLQNIADRRNKFDKLNIGNMSSDVKQVEKIGLRGNSLKESLILYS